MVGTDLIALFLAPLWAALKDKVNLKPAWHPWILVGITAGILSGTTVLHLGPGTWDDMWMNTVTIVGSVLAGYTVAKPLELLGKKGVTKVLPSILLLFCLTAMPVFADSLDVDTTPGGTVGSAIGASIQLWLGLLGGILARLIRRKVG